MDTNSKFCRFCLYEAESDSNTLRDIHDMLIEGLQKELNSIGININPQDNIPSLVCVKCLQFIEKLIGFIKTFRNTEEVLYQLYNIKKNELGIIDIKESPIKTKLENRFDQYGKSGDSDSSDCDNDIRKTIKKKRFCRPTSAKTCIEPRKKRFLKIRKPIKSDNELNNSDSNEDQKVFYPKLFKAERFKSFNTQVKNIQNNSVPYSCNVCSQKYDNFSEYQDHQDSHRGQYVFCCSLCCEIFSNRIDAVRHENSHKVACGVCNLELLPKSLAAHMMKHTDVYKCTTCDSRHSSRAAMQTHFRARHERRKGYICHICGKQNSFQASMRRHLATHFTHKPFKCKMCTFATRSKTALKVHVLRKHFNQQTNCDICTKVFKSELSLKQHKKRIHELKKHTCNLCGKFFSEKFNLNQHVKKKHVQQRIYECKVCHQEHYTVRKLKDHMRSHRTDCVKCQKCGKEFSYKKYLQKHEEKCDSNLNKLALSENVENFSSVSDTNNAIND